MFEKAKLKLEKEFDALRLLRRIHKLNILKLVLLKKHNLKLIKYQKKNTIDFSSDNEAEKKEHWKAPLRLIGYVRKLVEGSETNEIDYKVLEQLIPSDVLARMIPREISERMNGLKLQNINENIKTESET